MGRYDGKTVLLTGANGGIGRAIATRMLDEGARVALSDLKVDGLAEAFPQAGDRVLCQSCDVTDEASSAAFVAAALERFGRIDVAVLNAGIEGAFGKIGEVPVSEFDRVMTVNVRGVYIGLSQVMPAMKAAGGGSIVLTASTAGLRGGANMAPYFASKHAVVGLMRCAAVEGAPHGIRVNSINPGPIDTRMIRSIEDSRNAATASPQRVLVRDGIPLRRLGKPAEVAGLVAFLASDDGAFCTGQTYDIDGGTMSAR